MLLISHRGQVTSNAPRGEDCSSPARVVRLSAPVRGRDARVWRTAQGWTVAAGRVAPRASGRPFREALLGARAETLVVSGLRALMQIPTVMSFLECLDPDEAWRIAPAWQVDGIPLEVQNPLDFQLLRLVIVLVSRELG
jgi:hypothetical protein